LQIKEIYNYTIISTKDKEDDEESPTMDGNWVVNKKHSYDILGARMLWKPKEARILKNFIDQPV